MIFRIEDNESLSGCQREYTIPCEDLPRLKMKDLEYYIAEEIRKEVNNAHNKKLLSYSKSLGVCLLKYNEFTYNELHINDLDIFDFIYYYDLKKQRCDLRGFSLIHGLYNLESKHKNREIILYNIEIDISDNNLLDSYLRKVTGIGRKKVASPEKDKEVLLMQSPNDIVISTYLDSVYLLYALFLKYRMSKSIFYNLKNCIESLEDWRFDLCGETERIALLKIIEYLFYHGSQELEMSRRVLQDSCKTHMSIYFDPILQLLGIQVDSFGDSYALSDYNSNVISDLIWQCYEEVTYNN